MIPQFTGFYVALRSIRTSKNNCTGRHADSLCVTRLCLHLMSWRLSSSAVRCAVSFLTACIPEYLIKHRTPSALSETYIISPVTCTTCKNDLFVIPSTTTSSTVICPLNLSALFILLLLLLYFEVGNLLPLLILQVVLLLFVLYQVYHIILYDSTWFCVTMRPVELTTYYSRK